MEIVEINSIDIRFEHTRFKNVALERKLAASIMERDILEPLQVIVNIQERTYILLDGFKRYRCAKKLGKGMVPVEALGDDVVTGILILFRRDEAGGFTTMEQASLLDELRNGYGMKLDAIARGLNRSLSWVRIRLDMIDELSPKVQEKIMSGAFPARAYMYGIMGFARENKIPQQRVDNFVEATSGKGLSTRELFVLSRAYFSGGSAIEKVILEGDVHRALKLLKDEDAEEVIDVAHREFIKDLRNAGVSMRRVTANAGKLNMVPASCLVQVNLWSNTILTNLNAFTKAVKDLYDRSGPPRNSANTLQSGNSAQSDSTAAQD